MPPAAPSRIPLGAPLRAFLLRGWLTGPAAALAVILAGAVGGLRWMESQMSDAQVRWMGADMEAAQRADQVAYFEIDDATLANTGRWPWPRAWLADVVRELDRAGASVVALDLLLDETQEARLPKGGGAGGDLIRDDAILAEVLRQNGKTVLAARVAPAAHLDAAERWTLEQLCRDPLLTGDDLAARAKAARLPTQAALERLPSLKREALRLRVLEWHTRHGHGESSLEACHHDLLAELDGVHHDRHEAQFLDDVWNEREAVEAAARHWPPGAASDAPTRLIPPILAFASGATAVGGAPWSPDDDGVVRSCLLATPCDQNGASRMAPTLPVMAACLHLGIAPETMRMEGGYWVLPRRGQPDIRIPLLAPRPGERWGLPGPRAPVSWSADNAARQPVGPLVELARLDSDAAENEANADAQLMHLSTRPAFPVPLDLIERLREMRGQLAENPGYAHDAAFIASRGELLGETLQALKSAGLPLEEGGRVPAELAVAAASWRAATHQAGEGRLAAANLREQLHRTCAGKICLVGWTATGSLADFVTTPLGSRVPGMRVQGATMETILSGRFSRRGPLWLELALAAGFSGLLCLAAWRLSLLAASLAVVAASAAMFLSLGWIALGPPHLWIGSATILSAGLAAWSACMLSRTALEQSGRRRITAQFRNYVSPALVDHLVAHPELAELKNERREITCVFTDFAGFTTVSSQLDADTTARLLNRHLAAATQAFMAHGGNVNKFMGDGMLVFWGAPVANPDQALDACRGICACREALERAADDPALAGLPKLFLRAGATTGEAMVGDFGAPPARSDYTVIGDSVNLASRLESANKHLGTATLAGERTAAQAEKEFLFRPIARLKVVGRNAPETVFELLGRKSQATPAQEEAVRRSTEIMDAFTAGRWTDCLELVRLAEAAEPRAKWPALYRGACQAHLASPPLAHDGSLTLEHK